MSYYSALNKWTTVKFCTQKKQKLVFNIQACKQDLQSDNSLFMTVLTYY